LAALRKPSLSAIHLCDIAVVRQIAQAIATRLRSPRRCGWRIVSSVAQPKRSRPCSNIVIACFSA
jgi:hypothetical protein